MRDTGEPSDPVGTTRAVVRAEASAQAKAYVRRLQRAYRRGVGSDVLNYTIVPHVAAVYIS